MTEDTLTFKINPTRGTLVVFKNGKKVLELSKDNACNIRDNAESFVYGNDLFSDAFCLKVERAYYLNQRSMTGTLSDDEKTERTELLRGTMLWAVSEPEDVKRLCCYGGPEMRQFAKRFKVMVGESDRKRELIPNKIP